MKPSNVVASHSYCFMYLLNGRLPLTRFELPLGIASTAPDGRCRLTSSESLDNPKTKEGLFDTAQTNQKANRKVAGNRTLRCKVYSSGPVSDAYKASSQVAELYSNNAVHHSWWSSFSCVLTFSEEPSVPKAHLTCPSPIRKIKGAVRQD